MTLNPFLCIDLSISDSLRSVRKSVLIHETIIDLRKGIDSLSNIISQTYGMDPFQPGTLLMFCGRKTDRIKALIWEGDGFLLCYKRLEQKSSKFQWPRSQEEVCKLTSQQFRWLMEGLTIKPKKCIQKIDHPRFV